MARHRRRFESTLIRLGLLGIVFRLEHSLPLEVSCHPPNRVLQHLSQCAAAKSSTPLGTVSRVVTFIEDEALLTRNEKKVITAVDWPALLRRWVTDYSVTGSNVLRSYLEPRGLGALASKISKLGQYAVTGSLAVPNGVAPARLGMIYVENAVRAASVLELVPTETGGNVWLLEPYDDVVFERTL